MTQIDIISKITGFDFPNDNISSSPEFPCSSFDWDKARTFVVVLKTGSYTRAAKFLGTTQPTISRQISALEEQLGCKLICRSQGDIVLTSVGKQFYQSFHAMAVKAAEVATHAREFSDSLSGTIRIRADEMLAVHYLLPFSEALRLENQDITLDILDTGHHQIQPSADDDLSIRFDLPADQEQIVRRLGNVEYAIYGASRVTMDDTPMPLFILGVDAGNCELPSFLTEKLTPSCHNDWFKLAQVRRGLAILAMPTSMGDEDPLLKRQNIGKDSFSIPLWLCARNDIKHNKRIRHVFREAVKFFAATL